MIEPRPVIFSLLFGDQLRHHELHRRHLLSLATTLPSSVPWLVWCNQVHRDTRVLLGWRELRRGGMTHVHLSRFNAPKSYALGSTLQHLARISPNLSSYEASSLWAFDDDTHVLAGSSLGSSLGWFDSTLTTIMVSNARYAGLVKRSSFNLTQYRELQRSWWWKNITVAGEAPCPNGWFRFPYVYGPYVIASVATLSQLRWPDPRLKHNAQDSFADDDYVLGAAMLQLGITPVNLTHGVAIGDAPSRRNEALLDYDLVDSELKFTVDI